MSIPVPTLRVLGFFFGCCPLVAFGGSAHVFNVNTFADEIDDDVFSVACHTPTGKCSLRAAVMQANQLKGDSTIVLPAGTYNLTIDPAGANGADSGDLDLPIDGEPITISGASAATTIIDAGAIDDRVLEIGTARVVTLNGLTLRNGQVDGSGGGILNYGALTMTYCTLSGNSADFGGAIYTSAQDLTVILSRITLNGNAATEGGAIFNGGDDLRVERSTLSGNSATFGGGGIFNGVNGTEYVSNTTISHNRSDGDGGGIYNVGTTWTYNATIAFNEADADADIDGGAGGGIYNSGSFYPRNTLVVGNTHSGSPDLDDCNGTLGKFGQNWFSDLGGCTCVDQGPVAACSTIQSLGEIGPLQFNGGSTRTHALVGNSSILDSGIACINLGVPPVDQRGGLRDLDFCDPGAYEGGALPAGLIFADGFELGNPWAWG